MPKGKKKKENYSKKNPIPLGRSRSILRNGTKKPFSDEFIWFLILGLWAAGIFIASSVEGSGENYWDLRTFLERKGAHIFEFFVLAYLVWKVAYFWKIGFWRKIFFVFFIPFLYAVSDEIHQLFVFGREGKALDVGIDLIGILSFILLAVVGRRIFLQKKTPA